MPLYEYKCSKCGHRFEELRRHADLEREADCPKCKAKVCKKQISQTSFSLKGGGWASDGYAG